MESVRSVERAFALLNALAVHPATLSELAESAGLPKTTVARILLTLEQVDAVERDASGVYRVGDGIEALSSGGNSGPSALVISIRPYLAHLSTAVGEAAGLGLVDCDQIQHMVQEESLNAVQVMDFTGHSVPLHVSPGGICVLAYRSRDDIETYLDGDLDVYTPATVTDRTRIRDRLGTVRTVGYIWAYEEFAEGLTSVAAPLFDGHGPDPVGAVTVHGPSYRFPGDRDPAEIGALLVSVVERFHTRRGR